jgi:hypothetical protein
MFALPRLVVEARPRVSDPIKTPELRQFNRTPDAHLLHADEQG